MMVNKAVNETRVILRPFSCFGIILLFSFAATGQNESLDILPQESVDVEAATAATDFAEHARTGSGSDGRFVSPEVSIPDHFPRRFPRPPTPDGSPAHAEPDATILPDRFNWKGAMTQSLTFLGIQHAFRLTQPKTHTELDGNFFRDWGRSARNLRGWKDGDNAFINYVAHSLQGSATGRIFVNNSDKARRQEFGRSKDYWKSRGKALAWSAFWSTQFELGPVSESSIGNVGMYDDHGQSKMSWGDLVVTPFVGTGVLVGEDAIDKYILKNWLERKSGHKITNKIKLYRSLLTPTMSFANLLRGKVPWKRDNRR